jgi:uncharacterized protein YbbC (DUF1343 family)
MKKTFSILLILSMGMLGSAAFAGKLPSGYCPEEKPAVTLGCDRLLTEYLDLVKGKKVGLITNPTGVDSKLRSTIDLLYNHKDVKLVALYGPEHGIRGNEYAGAHVKSAVDTVTGVPIFSLYGKSKIPKEKMYKDVEVLIFDIQDIGTRSYTYINTMARCMQTAKELKIKIIVLDRPNPINGLVAGGPVLQPGFKSGIGIGPIAYVHGMTVGELAEYFNNEKDFNYQCDLTVIKMKGWKRDMTWSDTGLIWTITSPHIPEGDSSLYYPITGIYGETPLVNIGVGYTLPFKMTAAPWMDGTKVADALNAKKLPGVYFRPQTYKPYYSRYKGEMCQGFQIYVTDHKTFKPVETAYHIMAVLRKMYPEDFNFDREDCKKRHRMFDLANGTDTIRKDLMNGISAEKIIDEYQEELIEFMKKRAKYLIYK